MSFKLSKQLLLVFIVLIMIFLIPSSFAFDLNNTDIDSNSIYVSQDGSDNGDGSQMNPYNSLSKAVDNYNSTKNSNIYISNGNYDINEKITLNKDIIIVGQSKDSVILNGNNKNSLFEISSSNAVFYNLQFKNSNSTQGNYYGSAVHITSPETVVFREF